MTTHTRRKPRSKIPHAYTVPTPPSAHSAPAHTWADGAPKSTNSDFSWYGQAQTVDKCGRLKTRAQELLDDTKPKKPSKAMSTLARMKRDSMRVNGYLPLPGQAEAAKTFRIRGTSF